MNLNIGDKVKDFTLKDKHGQNQNLESIKKDYTVIFFYPKNNTIGCTKEVCSFNDLTDEFNNLNVTLIGISTDSPNSHLNFSKQYGLDLLLLSDQDSLISNYFGVINTLSKSKRAKRVTFILDKDLNVIYIYNKVKPATHGNDVLNKIKLKDFN